MRGFILGGLLVSLIACAALARADGPAQDRKAQRARVLEALKPLEQQRRVANLKITNADLAWRLANMRRQESIPEKTSAEAAEGKAWLEANEDVCLALQRKQADLYAEMVAFGETP